MTNDRIIDIFQQHGQYVTPRDYALIRSIAEAVAPLRTAAKGEDTRRAWVGLSSYEIQELYLQNHGAWQSFAYALEARMKEKNDKN